MVEQVPDLPVMELASAAAWDKWLAKHHASSPGVWLKIAKKGAKSASVSTNSRTPLLPLAPDAVEQLPQIERRAQESCVGSLIGKGARARIGIAEGFRRRRKSQRQQDQKYLRGCRKRIARGGRTR